MTIIEQIPLLYRTTKSWFKNNGRYAYGITICFFLLLASFIALFAVNQSVDQQNTLLENRYGEQISRTAANEETDPIADEITQSTELEKTTVNLLLQLKNIDDMFRQFSKQAQDEKYRDVKSSIQKSLKIYNGKIDAIDAQSIFITLSDNDEQQAVLNAICCAGLLLKTAREQRWFLKINAVIYQMENTINDTDKIAALKHIKEHSKESIFIEENAATLAETLRPSSVVFITRL